jgi:hypothetical protein
MPGTRRQFAPDMLAILGFYLIPPIAAFILLWFLR